MAETASSERSKPVPLPVNMGDGTRFEPYAVAMYGQLKWVVPLAEVAEDGTYWGGHTVLWRNVHITSSGDPS